MLVGFLISIPVVANLCYKKFFLHRDGAVNDGLVGAHYDGMREEISAARAEFEKMPCASLTCRATDGAELYAKYYDTGSGKTVIFMHGVRSVPLNNFALAAKRFLANGFNVLLPDQRAHGKSGGTHITYGHMESRDMLEWIKLIKARSDVKIVLYGVSMGAACIGFAADKIGGDVSAAVYESGFTSLGEQILCAVKKYRAPTAVAVLLKRKCRKKLNIDTDESVLEHIKNTTVPSVFVHGTADETVSVDDTRKYYAACPAPKELILVEGCGHTVASISGEAPRKIDEFIKKYI